MAALYEINAAIELAMEDIVDPETGEILDDTSVLDSLMMERDEKVENIALYIKNLKAEADAIRSEEKNLAVRRKSCESRAERLRTYLANNLQGEKFKTPRVAISWRRSEAVQIDDLQQIPAAYLRYKDPEPDKTAIKEAIKNGIDIQGAELVTNLSMQIK